MRDSVEIMLGGAMYSLRPTWGAYAEIEARTGLSLRALWFKFSTGDIKLSEMSAIIVAGMKANAGEMNISEQAAMRSIFDAGPWWDHEDGLSSKLISYLEALGWTPEQREKIQAEVEAENQAKTSSAKSSPSVPPSMG